MRQDKKLTAGLAAAMAIATLAGTSAFADSRPQRGTSGSGSSIRRSTGATRAEGHRGSGSENRSSEGRIRRNNDGGGAATSDMTVRAPRETRGGESRGTINRDSNRGETRVRTGENRNRSGYESDRERASNQRDRRESMQRRGGDSRYRAGAGYRTEPYRTRGRVERYQRYRDGYRVWIGGAPYPFYVPSRYWSRDRFRVGLWISLGGYYNSLGYYDYYDGYNDGYYDSRNSYYDRRPYSRGEIRGVVESVDGRRTSFVLRNEDTGDFITIVPRARRVYVRPGDYVEVDGTWSRSGLFTAYDIDWLDGDRRYDDDY